MLRHGWSWVVATAFIMTACATGDTYEGQVDAIDAALAGRSGFIAGRCPNLAGAYANAGHAVGSDGKDVRTFAFLQLFRPDTTVVDQGTVKISFDSNDHIVIRVVMGQNEDVITEQEWEPFNYFALKRIYLCGRGAAILTIRNLASGTAGWISGESEFLYLYKLKTGELAVRKREHSATYVVVVPVEHEDSSTWYRFAPVLPN